MEEVESSSNINNLLSRLRALAVRKLVGISTISTYNSHADCTKMDDFLQISRMATWRSFWVVGRNCETPVQGDLAEESVLISELRLWSTLKYKICKNAKKSQMCKKNWIASSFLSCDFDLALQCARCEIQFAICSLCSMSTAHLWAETLTHLPDWDMLWQSDTGCTCDFIIDPVALNELAKVSAMRVCSCILSSQLLNYLILLVAPLQMVPGEHQHPTNLSKDNLKTAPMTIIARLPG